MLNWSRQWSVAQDVNCSRSKAQVTEEKTTFALNIWRREYSVTCLWSWFGNWALLDTDDKFTNYSDRIPLWSFTFWRFKLPSVVQTQTLQSQIGRRRRRTEAPRNRDELPVVRRWLCVRLLFATRQLLLLPVFPSYIQIKDPVRLCVIKAGWS